MESEYDSPGLIQVQGGSLILDCRFGERVHDDRCLEYDIGRLRFAEGAILEGGAVHNPCPPSPGPEKQNPHFRP
jgi:hypothetical protein